MFASGMMWLGVILSEDRIEIPGSTILLTFMNDFMFMLVLIAYLFLM